MIAQNFLVVLFYGAYMFLPGYVILWSLNKTKYLLPLSFGFSLSVLVLSEAILFLVLEEWSVKHWVSVSHGAITSFFVVGLMRRYSGMKPSLNSTIGTPLLLGGVIALSGFVVYHLWAGPYTEVPADFWSRIGDVNEIWEGMAQANAGGLSVLATGDRFFVPFLHALVAEVFGYPPIQMVSAATLATTTVFLGIAYWFSVNIFLTFRWSTIRTIATAILAVWLYVIVFGVASFSYIRYYAYFPHIIGFSLLLVTVILYQKLLDGCHETMWLASCVLLFCLTMFLMNKQEALFAVAMICGLSAWRFFRDVFAEKKSINELAQRGEKIGKSIMFLSAIGATLLFLIRPRGDAVYPHIISFDLGSLELLVANPFLRLWDTIGLFGLLVYFGYALRLKIFAKKDLLNFGMAIPIITLLNPMFVELFLRLGSWDSIWRMAFLIPTPIIGAVLISEYTRDLQKSKSIAKRVGSGVVLISLLISVLPYKSPSGFYSESRVPSLMPLNDKAGLQLWADLIGQLHNIPGKRHVITDPITGYVVNSVTKHSGKKDGKGIGDKSSWQLGRTVFARDYSDRLLSDRMTGSLLILNKRDGPKSWVGETSGHWRDDILEVSSEYPVEIWTLIENNPKRFKLLWSADKIELYELIKVP